MTEAQEINSLAVFEFGSEFKVDVRLGKYPKPFLLFQQRILNTSELRYFNKSVLLSIKQYVLFRDAIPTLSQFARCVMAGGEEMLIKLDKLLTVYVGRDGYENTYMKMKRTRKNATQSSSGKQSDESDEIKIDWEDFELLKEKIGEINACILTAVKENKENVTSTDDKGTDSGNSGASQKYTLNNKRKGDSYDSDRMVTPKRQSHEVPESQPLSPELFGSQENASLGFDDVTSFGNTKQFYY
ncbi:unnamed protein product [Owenia fusiformis]|uniref:Uncharacterized protein n=1 Tax=Owenia fusiformis TaxID=6347 RepID=A0A8S4NQ36_OWEFU|nr:unnamed protein product [Owenia fusiformis]